MNKITLLDALLNVDKSETNTDEVNLSALCGIVDVYEYDVNRDKLNYSLKAYWVKRWICTDTPVGIQAIYLYGTLVAYSTRTGRKNKHNIYFLNKQYAENVASLVRYCIDPSSPDYPIASTAMLLEEIDPTKSYHDDPYR